MTQHGLTARGLRKLVHTLDGRHDLPRAANLLARRFNPSTPIMHGAPTLPTPAPSALAVMLDLYSMPSMPATRGSDTQLLLAVAGTALSRAFSENSRLSEISYGKFQVR